MMNSNFYKKIILFFLLLSFSFSQDKTIKSLDKNWSYNHGLWINLNNGIRIKNSFNFFYNKKHRFYPSIQTGFLTSFFVPAISLGIGYHYNSFNIEFTGTLGLPILRENNQLGKGLYTNSLQFVQSKDDFKKRILNYYQMNMKYSFDLFYIKTFLYYGNIYQSLMTNKKNYYKEPLVQTIAQSIIRYNIQTELLLYSSLYNDIYLNGSFGLMYNTKKHYLSLSYILALPLRLAMTGWGELLIQPRINYKQNLNPDKVYDKIFLFSITNSTDPNPIRTSYSNTGFEGNFIMTVPITYRIYPFFWMKQWKYGAIKGIYIAPTFYSGFIWNDITKSGKNFKFGYAFIGNIGYRAYKMRLNISFGIGYSPQKHISIVYNFLGNL